jgi:hypothetical protein
VVRQRLLLVLLVVVLLVVAAVLVAAELSVPADPAVADSLPFDCRLFMGWRSLPEHALRFLASAAAYVFGGEATAQCLTLVLKRSLPAILVKSGFSYIG